MFGDCHIHMILDGVYYRAAIDAQKERVDEALVRARLEAYRAAGIHFLRDGGDAWGVGSFAARIAGEYGVDYRTPAFPIHRRGRYGGFIGRGYDTLKEYATLVGSARAQGADFIKIMISGLMDFDCYGRITSEPLPAEEIRELIRIAHAEGFAVMAHANGADTVKAAVEAAEGQGLPEKAAGYLRTADSEIDRMAALTGDLLMLARGDAASWRATLRPLGLDTFLIELYDGFSLVARRSGHPFELLLPEGPLPGAMADGERLKQLLTVLLNNAVEHTEKGTAIELAAFQNKNAAVIEVRDHG